MNLHSVTNIHKCSKEFLLQKKQPLHKQCKSNEVALDSKETIYVEKKDCLKDLGSLLFIQESNYSMRDFFYLISNWYNLLNKKFGVFFTLNIIDGILNNTIQRFDMIIQQEILNNRNRKISYITNDTEEICPSSIVDLYC